MKTLRQFLLEFDADFLVSMIGKTLAVQSPLYMTFYYNGIYEEGFIEDVPTVNDAGDIFLEFRTWSSDENTYVPAGLTIDRDDVDKFYIGTAIHPSNDKKVKALLAR